MGWIRTTGIAAIGMAAAMLAASSVRAQDADSSHQADLVEARQMVGRLQELLGQLTEGTGIDVPDLGPVFDSLFEAALPPLPEDGNTSFSVGFKIMTNRTSHDALEADEDRTPYYPDAQACASDQPGQSVVYFERLVVEGGTGHHCVTTGPGKLDPQTWTLFASYRVETPQQRLESRFAAAAAAGDESGSTYEEALAVGDPQIAALIAVSAQIGQTSARILRAGRAPEGDPRNR